MSKWIKTILSVLAVFLSWPTVVFLSSVLYIKNNIAKKLNKRNIQSKFYIQWPWKHPSPDTRIRTACLVAVFGIHELWATAGGTTSKVRGPEGLGKKWKCGLGIKALWEAHFSVQCPFYVPLRHKFGCRITLCWLCLFPPDALVLSPSMNREKSAVSFVFSLSLVFEEHRNPLMFKKKNLPTY